MEQKAKRKKTGGRKKGTPNKVNSNMKKEIAEYLGDNIYKLFSEMNKLEGIAYIDKYLALTEFTVPKLARQDIVSETKVNIESIEIDFGD